MKQNKIIVAEDADPARRRKILQRILIEKRFAITPGDALKLISPSVSDINLQDAYFVIADNVNLRQSAITRHRLYEMAARGMAVIIGTKKLQTEFEFMCEVYYGVYA